MKTKIILFLESLKGSFWFIPVLMIFGAMAMSFSMVFFDRELHIDTLRFYGFMFAVSPEGARPVLSTIAGSMMTVAGVTFSITIVALILLIMLVGGLPTWQHSRKWGYYPSGVVGVILIVLLVLMLMGRI